MNRVAIEDMNTILFFFPVEYFGLFVRRIAFYLISWSKILAFMRLN